MYAPAWRSRCGRAKMASSGIQGAAGIFRMAGRFASFAAIERSSCALRPGVGGRSPVNSTSRFRPCGARLQKPPHQSVWAEKHPVWSDKKGVPKTPFSRPQSVRQTKHVLSPLRQCYKLQLPARAGGAEVNTDTSGDVAFAIRTPARASIPHRTGYSFFRDLYSRI